jgi:hypothetical protein
MQVDLLGVSTWRNAAVGGIRRSGDMLGDGFARRLWKGLDRRPNKRRRVRGGRVQQRLARSASAKGGLLVGLALDVKRIVRVGQCSCCKGSLRNEQVWSD